MLDAVKAIILDAQEARPDTGVPRRTGIKSVRGKATVCIGVRRSGKSTYMYQILDRLVAGGVSRENIVYLNFFDDRLHRLRYEGLAVIAEAYYSLYPEKKGEETVYFFFDEIQAVAGWEAFVERLMRTEKCDIYLTGSSAHMLSKEVATQMRGRALSWEMFPFSFREFLDARGIEAEGALSSKRRFLVRKGFDEYWERGGFPETLDLDSNLRIKTHQEYLNAILFRDLVERHDISHPRAISDLVHWLIDNIASPYSVNRLTGYLKALGHKVPKMSVSDYLSWFEDAYFLFSVRVFDASLARSQTNPKKVYCVDHALVRSIATGALLNSGRLLENMVFVALRRSHPNVYYYKTASGKEVDFLVPLDGRKRMLVQVCESLADEGTRKRELAALREAMEELRLSSASIVTKDEHERIRIESRTIDVLPAWRFLLDR